MFTLVFASTFLMTYIKHILYTEYIINDGLEMVFCRSKRSIEYFLNPLDIL